MLGKIIDGKKHASVIAVNLKKSIQDYINQQYCMNVQKILKNNNSMSLHIDIDDIFPSKNSLIDKSHISDVTSEIKNYKLNRFNEISQSIDSYFQLHKKDNQDSISSLTQSLCTVTRPCLAIIHVGNNSASAVYIRNKIRKANELGIDTLYISVSEDIIQEDIINIIKSLNVNDYVHGIIVQLPLPNHLNSIDILESISHIKDVDGLHPLNLAYLSLNIDKGIKSCTPLGCLHLLKATLGSDLSGLSVVILGRSNIVGKPLSYMLTNENCTVSIAHSQTKNLIELTKQADIVVSAIGKPHFLNANFFKPSATVLDVGINRIDTNIFDRKNYTQNDIIKASQKIVGDVDFYNTIDHVQYITPVPGGIGPMTVICLLQNTFDAYKNLQSSKK